MNLCELLLANLNDKIIFIKFFVKNVENQK
jgi:hypothetical protein